MKTIMSAPGEEEKRPRGIKVGIFPEMDGLILDLDNDVLKGSGSAPCPKN